MSGPQVPTEGLSTYVSANADGTYTANYSGISSLVDQKAPNFGAALAAGIEQGLEAAAVADLAIGAVLLATQIGAAATASTVAAAAAGSAAASGTLLGAAAGASATGVGIAVAIVVAVPAVLLAAWPAQPGTGCCGTDTTKPYGSCDPADWRWEGKNGVPTPCGAPGTWVAGPAAFPPGSPKTFDPGNVQNAVSWVNAVIEETWNKTNTCWSIAPPLAPILASAVTQWNASHAGPSVTIRRRVNTTCQGVFGGNPYSQPNQPESNEPIAVALNGLAMSGQGPSQPWPKPGVSFNQWSGGSNPADTIYLPTNVAVVPENATMTLSLNVGPLIQRAATPAPQAATPAPQAAKKTGAATGIALAVGGAALATAAGVGIFAAVKGIAYDEAWGRLWGALKSQVEGSGTALATAHPTRLLARGVVSR
jgi:hypothetical protein